MKCVLYSRKTGTFLPKSGGREWDELPASFRPLIGIVADCLGIRPHCGWQTRAVRKPPRYPMNPSSGKRQRERSPKDAFTWYFAQNLHCLDKNALSFERFDNRHGGDDRALCRASPSTNAWA